METQVAIRSIILNFTPTLPEKVIYIENFILITVAKRVVLTTPHNLVAKPRAENEEHLPIGTEEVLHTNHYGSKTVPMDNLVEDKVKQCKRNICNLFNYF